MTFNVTVTDINGISSVTVNGTSMSQNGNIWNITRRPGQFNCNSDGACLLNIVAVDSVGNVNNSKNLLFTIDNSPPNSSVNILPVFIKNLSFNVSWAGNDSISGISSFDIEVSDNNGIWALWQSSTSNASAVYSGQDSHTYGFRSKAKDNTGNSETKTESDSNITIDVTPPIINLTNPSNNSVVRLGSMLNLTIIDAISLNTAWYNKADSNFTINYPYRINTSNWTTNNYTINVFANDSVNNLAKAVFNFSVRLNHPPILNISTNITVNESDFVNLTFMANISATDVEGDSLIFSYDAPLDISGNWQTSFTDARTYTVTVTVNDSDGGGASQQVTITVLDKPNGANDTVTGNFSDIKTTVQNLGLRINNSLFNSSAAFVGANKLNFTDGNKTILEFNYNFTNLTKFSFVNIKINSTFINNTQTLIISGINLTSQGTTKTAYMNRTNTTYNSVCIKDSEIASVTEMSSGCSNSADETQLPCDGIATNSYTCALEDSFYKITGLRNSGIKQISYDRPSSGSGSSSSSGGGGGGGGGGGSAPGSVCNMDWKCVEWPACSNGKQSRRCDFVKVPQHSQDEACPESSKSPEIIRSCESKAEAAKPAEELKTEEKLSQSNSTTSKASPETKEKKENFLSAITGRFTKNTTTTDKILWVSIAITVAGLLYARRRFQRNSQ